MPHATPFHFSSPVCFAYTVANFMANMNSHTLEKWTIQVGIDSAFTGSIDEPIPSAPRPPRNGSCASKWNSGTPVAIKMVAATAQAAEAKHRELTSEHRNLKQDNKKEQVLGGIGVADAASPEKPDDRPIGERISATQDEANDARERLKGATDATRPAIAGW